MVVCHFNDPHLSYAINSLKKQSRKTSIVIVDDGSDPKFKRVYQNVKIIELPQNRGVGYARNIGLNYALERNYDYIGFLDSDGVAHSLFIQKAVDYLNSHGNILGVSAKKDIANPSCKIAMLKYRYKIFARDDFQIDCSLFKAKALKNRNIPSRRVAEDSVFLRSFSQNELSKLSIPYHHFERSNIPVYFKDEFYGAFYSCKPRDEFQKVLKRFLITPYSSIKMILVKGWFLEGLFFPLRQMVWLTGFLIGYKMQYF